jgi:NAD(P)-dependent dehydrogenase (short-subunit alcohol dehydrogenase family)
MRLANKNAIVIGAGRGPGTGMGNGRATVIRFAQEGARVLAVDRDLASAQQTCAMAARDGKGPCEAYEADVTIEATLKDMIAHAQAAWGRIDILHYNVGLSIAGGDAPPDAITEEAFDRIVRINLRGMITGCKYVLPVMRAQQSGVIFGISSLAAIENYPYVTYKATKAAMIAYLQQLAIHEAGNGIRANVILPGLMDTPMAVDARGIRARAAPRWRRCAIPTCRCATRWVPLGTSPTPRCSSPPTRPISSPASHCRWTAGSWSRSAEKRAFSGQIACGQSAEMIRTKQEQWPDVRFTGTSADAARSSREPRVRPG